MVSPSIAKSPSIAIGTNNFLKLKISAMRQKTPRPDMAINVIICYFEFGI